VPPIVPKYGHTVPIISVVYCKLHLNEASNLFPTKSFSSCNTQVHFVQLENTNFLSFDPYVRISYNLTDNAGLSIDQKVRTQYKYHTVDKAIRHKMSTISSADGHYQQRKLKEQCGKSRERAVFPNAFCVLSNRKWKQRERWVSGESWDSNLMVSKCDNPWENRSLARRQRVSILIGAHITFQ